MNTVIPMVIVAILFPVNARATCNYPCEIDNPDESQRWAVPCVDAPEGTAIENEPCKECDGSGEIQNKDDGAACTINGKPGECCEGTCYEIPGEGEDPCDWAAANQGKYSQTIQDQVWGDATCYGYVVCINGDTTECVIREHIENQNPDWTAEMINCVCTHELNHMNTGMDCPPCGYGVGTLSDPDQVNQSECSAYSAQWECLNDIEPQSQTIIDAKSAYWNYMLDELNCPEMPDLFD